MVHNGAFDEAPFFAALHASGARVLLIGRRALVALGIPVLTADYDLWVHPDDIEQLNQALAPLDLSPNHPPQAARARGRYVLENDEHVDVLVARQSSTADGDAVIFEEVWQRREEVTYEGGGTVSVPSLDDLIRTKRWSTRQKDVADIQLLEALKRRRAEKR